MPNDALSLLIRVLCCIYSNLSTLPHHPWLPRFSSALTKSVYVSFRVSDSDRIQVAKRGYTVPLFCHPLPLPLTGWTHSAASAAQLINHVQEYNTEKFALTITIQAASTSIYTLFLFFSPVCCTSQGIPRNPLLGVSPKILSSFMPQTHITHCQNCIALSFTAVTE